MKARTLIIAVAVLVGIGSFVLFGGGTKSEADHIREVVHAIVDGAEERDAAEILDHVSDEYRDSFGMDKDTLTALLFRQFMKRGPILIVPGPIQVDLLSEDRATAAFGATIVEGGQNLAADGINWTVDFRREDGDWRITGHTRDGGFE